MGVIADFASSLPGAPRGIGVAALWLLILLPASLTGLGILACRALRISGRSAAFAPALGLGAFVAAGSILNLLRIAYPWAITGLILAGLAVAVAAAGRRLLHPDPIAWVREPGAWVLLAFAAALMVLMLTSQASPRVYNWRDDLQKYFVHPIRMLETGTVYGSPLSAVGSETLGALACVDAAVIVFLPLRDINGADAVLGCLLCLAPLVAFGIRERSQRPVAAVAMLAVILIDPFYVNISALYLGSALIAGAIALTADAEPGGGRAAALGLLYGGLLALKPTFVLFVGVHLGVLMLAAASTRRRSAAAMPNPFWAAVWIALFLAPWIALHAPHYLAALHAGAVPLAPTPRAPWSIAWWGEGPLGMGLTGLRGFTVLVGILFLFAAFCAARIHADQPGDRPMTAAACASAAAVLCYPLMLIVFPRLVGYADADPDAVRYFAPFAMGSFPCVLGLASVGLRECPWGRKAPRAAVGIGIIAGLVGVSGFVGTAAARYRDAYRYGTVLPFGVAREPSLAAEMDEALDGRRLAVVRALQQRVPAGASIIAWTNCPFLLDFSRNRILDAETAGISSGWASVPQADYVLWEYRGFADPEARTRQIIDTLPGQNRGRIARLEAFDSKLKALVDRGERVFQDNEFLLCRVRTP